MTITSDKARPPGPSSGTIPVNGLDVYYEIHGRRDPLFLLHGALGYIVVLPSLSQP